MKVHLIILAVLLSFNTTFTQEEDFPATKQKILRMGGAGGLTPYLLFWNVKEINNALKTQAGPQLDNQPILLLGGEGYGYIMLLENFRIGGLGVGGSTKSTKVLGTTRMDMEANVTFGGVTLNYVIPVSERLDFVIGSTLGWGGLDLKLRRDNWGIKKWDDILGSWGSTGTIMVNDFSYNITSSFFIVHPNIKIEYAILRWLSFRVGVGYLGMIGGKWKLDDQFELVGVPNKLKADGIILDAGLFFGTFIF